MTLKKVSAWLGQSAQGLQQQLQEDLQREQLAQPAGKDEVMATELLVLQLPILAGWDSLHHFSVYYQVHP